MTVDMNPIWKRAARKWRTLAKRYEAMWRAEVEARKLYQNGCQDLWDAAFEFVSKPKEGEQCGASD